MVLDCGRIGIAAQALGIAQVIYTNLSVLDSIFKRMAKFYVDPSFIWKILLILKYY